VDDLCRGLLASMEGPAHGPVNLGHPEERSVRGLAEDILKRCGSKSSLQHVERALDDPDRRCPDLQEARRRWNWEPQISLEEGLERMIKDFRERLGGAC
jgi:dTDP-glucose 4,6-dehydratase